MKLAENALVDDVEKLLAVVRPSPVMQDFHLLHWGTKLQDFHTLFESKVCYVLDCANPQTSNHTKYKQPRHKLSLR